MYPKLIKYQQEIIPVEKKLCSITAYITAETSEEIQKRNCSYAILVEGEQKEKDQTLEWAAQESQREKSILF